MFLVLQLVVTAMLAGLCWTVQLVVYPQFSNVPAEAFGRYHTAHSRLITPVVAPLMLAELLLSTWLALNPPFDPGLAWGLLALTGVVWLSTGLIQVPLHALLERRGFDDVTARRLVRSNWVRTAAWTARTAILFGILV